MSRLIDADELITAFPCGETVRTECVRATIKHMPTIKERKKGKWIDNSEDGYVECPFCHSATNCDDNIDELHFCFSCGAELRGAT